MRIDLARSPEQIGNTMRRQRRRLGLTQMQLAEKAGLRQATISCLEAGNPAARIDTLLALLAALDLEFQIAPRSRGISHGKGGEDTSD